MKKYFLWILLGLCLASRAQRHDAQWVTGPLVSVIDFRNDTTTIRLLSNYYGLSKTCGSICDENGNLLFISNGYDIRDSSGNKVKNSDSLSPCLYTFNNKTDGLNINQAVLFLPKPGDSRYYYLFHFSNDSFIDARPITLYFSLIDKEGNFGLGEVVEKNRVLLASTPMREGGMTACKHANGRDYWIIKARRNSNRFYKFLLTPNGTLGPYIQDIGPVYMTNLDIDYSKFSQDGSKFVTCLYSGRILVTDFDRCSGELSNPVTIYSNASIDPVNHPESGGASVEFSPNNRFVYVSHRLWMTQYDLWSSNIQDSVEVYRADSSDFAQMDFLQTAPNGKIYACTWGGGFKFWHVINQPNEKGDSCEFLWGGQPTLSINSSNLPNMINYNLGALAGSGCDTITNIREQASDIRQIRTHPNPADKYLYVEMPQPVASGVYEMYLLNELGQVVQRRETKQVDIFDTEALPNGIYLLVVSPANHPSHAVTQKIVIQHGW